MPRNGSNVYSLPAGTYGVAGEVIESAAYNTFLDDLVADLNTARAISVGGTGATTAGNALINLRGLAIYPSRANFEGGSPPLALAQWCILHDDTILHYVADASGTAITSGNGLKGSPSGDALFEHWGAVGDGTTDNANAMEDAITSGVRVLRTVPGKSYYFNRTLTFDGVTDLLIDLTGSTIVQGAAADGWRFNDHDSVIICGGGTGLWRGNYATAGAWESLSTTGGFTTGDSGTSASTYTGVSTINVANLDPGYVPAGARLSYTISGTTYTYTVQSNVSISGGTATGITLDRTLDVSLPSGTAVTLTWTPDKTGTAASSYTSGSTDTITINGLSPGYVKKGARVQYIVAGTTYSHIVQADVQILAGTATNVQLDRNVAANISSGQAIYCNEWTRRMVLASAYTAGASTITLECGDVTSAAGTPRILAGDQFCPYGNYNDITDVDYSVVAEAAANATFSGSYPAKTVTITLVEPLDVSLPVGTMVTSIQDHRNNRFAPILFFGGANSGVIGMKLTGARVHGFVANACIAAPWNGVDPSTKPNNNMVFADNRDSTADGAGAFIVGAWTSNMEVRNNSGVYDLGDLRSLCQIERSNMFAVDGNYIYGGQYLANVNGECADGKIIHNRGDYMRRMIRQGNTSKRILIAKNSGVMSATYSDYGVLVTSGALDEDEADTGSVLRINDTIVSENQFSGLTRTAGGYGSHIMVGPQNLDTAAASGDWPRAVRVIGNTCIEPSVYGIYLLLGDNVEVENNTVLSAGTAGIWARGGTDNTIVGNTIVDAGEITPTAGVVLYAGERWTLAENRTVVDTGTGMTQGVDMQSAPAVLFERDNDWNGSVPTTFGPGNGGATFDGTTDDLAAYNAAFAAAPTEFRFLIEKPSNISAGVTRGGKEPLFETTGPMTWPSTTVFGRAMSGVVTNGQANIARKVFHANLNDTDGGTAVFVSARMGVSGAVASYQRNGLLAWVLNEDVSTLNTDEDDDPASNVSKGAVGIEGRGYIAAGNTAGKVWGGLFQGRVLATSDGSATGIEVGLWNEGSVVTDLASPIKKQGITIIAKVGEMTSGLHVKKGASGDGFVYGLLVGSTALAGTNGRSAFEYQNYWRVAKGGAMYLGKATGAETEQGIELQQDGDAVFTKSSGVVSVKGVRASAMGAAGGVVNLDADAVTSAGTQRNVGRLAWYLTDHTDGSEDAELRISAIVAGTLAQRAAIGDGMVIGPAATMPGAGNLYCSGFVRTGSYTVATVPSASAAGNGAMIFVSDESGGPVMAYAHGSNWRRVTDRAIIS